MNTENIMRMSLVRAACTGLLAIVTAAALTAQAADAPTLKDPSTLTADAPEQFKVRFETTKGDFVVEVHRDWSPRGAIRFYNLVKNGYYNDNAFFRVLPSIAQFGITGDPAINAVWRGARVIDDVRKQTNERGYVSYAAGGPNTRTTQVFINLKDNKALDQANMVPFGRVTSGLNNLDKLYSNYADGPPSGKGPVQAKIHAEGNAYLQKEFPKLDYIKTATLVEDDN
jgi:peptidyl-prolyl cis-trans isomerase A (cyclophilin A)